MESIIAAIVLEEDELLNKLVDTYKNVDGVRDKRRALVDAWLSGSDLVELSHQGFKLTES